jgi:hypothetical protein
MRTRRAIPNQERQAIFEAWNNKCAYCEAAPAEEVDHIIPFSKGGECELENFAAACARCNSRKLAHELPTGYLAIIQAIANDKASRIRKKLEDSRKKVAAKKVKTSKVTAKKTYNHRDSFYILASSICDWSEDASYILNNLQADENCTELLCFRTNKQELKAAAYAFNILCKLPTGYSGNAFSGVTEYLETGEIILHVYRKFMPFLCICAKKMPKKQEVIKLPIEKNMLEKIKQNHKTMGISEEEYDLLNIVLKSL